MPIVESMTRTRSGDRGFTLVELLVVMIVVSVLAGIAVPTLLTTRRKAYEASVKSDVQTITKEVLVLYGDEVGAMTIRSSGGEFLIEQGGTVLARGEMSPHNEVSDHSHLSAGGDFCLSVRNTRGNTQFWTADDVGLRTGDCAPPPP